MTILINCTKIHIDTV